MAQPTTGALIPVAAATSVLSVQSSIAAHGPVERGRFVHMAAAVVGVVAAGAVDQAGRHDGDLVYADAGVVGICSGDPKDVERLLVAGAYYQAQLDRKAGVQADAK